MKKAILILLIILVAFIHSVSAQNENRWIIINNVVYGLNGAGDISGYLLGIGISKKISLNNAIALIIENGEFTASKFDVIEFRPISI